MEKIIQIEELKDIINYYKKGFKLKNKVIKKAEYYIDAVKGKVIFEIYMEDKEEEK